MLEAVQFGGQVLLAGGQVPQEFARHRNEGDSAMRAGLKTGGSFFANAALSPAGAIAYGVGMAGIPALIRSGQGYTNKIHSAAVPFSQRFDHSRMTSRMQSFGLSHMGASAGVGNEAAAYYGAYGR